MPAPPAAARGSNGSRAPRAVADLDRLFGWKHEQFARKYFTTDRILKQYLYLIDLIRTSEVYESGLPVDAPIIYDF